MLERSLGIMTLSVKGKRMNIILANLMKYVKLTQISFNNISMINLVIRFLGINIDKEKWNTFSEVKNEN